MTLSPYPTSGPNRARLWIAAAAFACLLAACNKAEPDGQVIAIANGEEITLGELNEEARARGLPIVSNGPLRDSVIRDLVDRKLLVQKALKQKLDRTPEHLLAVRRLTEMLLAQELIADTQNEADKPTDREVAAFIQANPRAFDQRVLLSVDQIGFAPVADSKLQSALTAAPTLDSIDQLLTGGGIARTRDVAQWDSANLAPDVIERLLTTGSSGTVVMPQGDRMIAARVLSVTPRPTLKADQPAVAREWIARQRTNTVFQQLVQRARAKAKIDYQPDFDPNRRGAAPQAR